MGDIDSRSIIQVEAARYYRVQGPISLRSTAFLELARGILSRGQRFRFSAPGSSMSPVIRDRDIVTIAPITGRSVGIGDIVALSLPGDDGVVVHRVVGLCGYECLTKGDTVPERDGIVPYDTVPGVVVGVERDGIGIRAGLGWKRVLTAHLSRAGCLRPFISAGTPFVRAVRRLF